MSASTPTSASAATLVGGRVETGLAALGSLRWVVVDLTLPLEEARRRLDLSPISAVALGRALTAAVLLRRIALKVPSRIVLVVAGDGALGRVVAEAEAGGGVRGMVGNPRVETPADGSHGAGALASAAGRSTSPARHGEKRYSSQVELVTGEIGLDLAHFLEQSEQIRSAVLLGVLPQSIGIAAAGGLIVEALPGTPPEVLEQLESNVRGVTGVSPTLAAGGLGALNWRCCPASMSNRSRSSRSPIVAAAIGSGCDPSWRRSPQRSWRRSWATTGLCAAECAFCGERYRVSSRRAVA